MSFKFNEVNMVHFSHQPNIKGWVVTQRLNAFVDVCLLKHLSFTMTSSPLSDIKFKRGIALF